MNASNLVPDDLWEAIEPLFPEEPPKPQGGRPRIPDRAALGGIVFVLRTGCPWRLLPKELGCGSGTTCWRRLRDWQEAGVWQRLHEHAAELAGRRGCHRLDAGERRSLERAGKKGGEQTGPNPTDRGKRGSKYHLVVDRDGIPLAVRLSAANAHDADPAAPAGRCDPTHHRPTGKPGRPRKRPAKLHADKAYDSSALRRALRISRHHPAHRTPWHRL